MRKVVEALLSSDITSAQIARETELPESVVRKIRLEYQTLSRNNFEGVEKLYFYALEILKMKSFVTLDLQATIKYAAQLEEINFYEFEKITMNLEAINNQTVELQFDEFSGYLDSDNKEKFSVNIQNEMGDNEYSVYYLNSLNLNDYKKAEIVFDNADDEQIEIKIDIESLYITAEEIEDDGAEFRKMMEQSSGENDDVFKGFTDK